MAGFLTGLGLAGTLAGSAGRNWQNLQNVQQQNLDRSSFGKALDALGPDPEYEMARQMFKAGASPNAITSVMGGDIGKSLQQSAMQQHINDIIADKTMSDTDKQMRLVGIGAMTPDKFYELQTQAAKPKPATPAEMQAHIGTWANSNPPGVPADVLARAKAIAQDPNPNPADLEEFDKSVIPSFDKFHQAAGPDATEIKGPFWEGGKAYYKYVPKQAPAGTIAGEAPPRAGAAQLEEGKHVLASAVQGMNRLQKTIGDYKMDKSRAPMWGTVIRNAMHMAGDPKEQEIVGQVSMIHTAMIGMVDQAWRSRNPTKADEITKYHIPQVGDAPVLILQKIHDWMEPGGYFDQYKTLIGEQADAAAAAGGAGGGASGINDWR